MTDTAIALGRSRVEGKIDEVRKLLRSHRHQLPQDVTLELEKWCDDGKPVATSRRSDEADKFSELILIARRIPACDRYFVDDLEINPSTLWRWSVGQHKPAIHSALNVAGDILNLVSQLLQKPPGASKIHRATPKVAGKRHKPTPQH